MGYPTVTYKEKGMREGMQIEDASIPIEDSMYEGGIYPWCESIRSEQRPDIHQTAD